LSNPIPAPVATSLNPDDFDAWAMATLPSVAQPVSMPKTGHSKKFIAVVFVVLTIAALVVGTKVFEFLAQFHEYGFIGLGLWFIAIMLCVFLLARQGDKAISANSSTSVDDIMDRVAERYGLTPIDPEDGLVDIETWRAAGIVPPTGHAGFTHAYMGKWQGRAVIMADTTFTPDHCRTMLVVVGARDCILPVTTLLSPWREAWPAQAVTGVPAMPPHPLPLAPELEAFGYQAFTASIARPDILDAPLSQWLWLMAKRRGMPPMIAVEPHRLLLALPYNSTEDQLAPESTATPPLEIGQSAYRHIAISLSFVETLNRYFLRQGARQTLLSARQNSMRTGPSTICIALLDRFAPAIETILEAALPDDWTLIKAETPDYPDRAAAIQEADVVFVMGGAMPAEVIQAGNRLKFIQKLGAGVDNIDLATAKARGVAVARLAAGNAIPVAEHTLMLMLASCRRLITVDRQTRAGEWVKEDGRSKNRHMHGKRVGIIGLGAIGRALAQLLTGFGVEVVYSDPVHPPSNLAKRLNVTPMDLDELVATSDIVTLHCPLLPETRHILSAERVATMKSTAILINCARGGLVDEAALNAALTNKHIFAAGLDVFEKEPPGASPLFDHDNLIVSAHLAGATLDNFANVARRSVENAQGYLQNGDLPASDEVVKP